MRKIQLSDATTHLPRLIDDVERGESLVITRNGRAVAKIVPEIETDWDDVRKAVAEMKAARKGAGRITVGEILSARDEGRK